MAVFCEEIGRSFITLKWWMYRRIAIGKAITDSVLTDGLGIGHAGAHLVARGGLAR